MFWEPRKFTLLRMTCSLSERVVKLTRIGLFETFGLPTLYTTSMFVGVIYLGRSKLKHPWQCLTYFLPAFVACTLSISILCFLKLLSSSAICWAISFSLRSLSLSLFSRRSILSCSDLFPFSSSSCFFCRSSIYDWLKWREFCVAVHVSWSFWRLTACAAKLLRIPIGGGYVLFYTLFLTSTPPPLSLSLSLSLSLCVWRREWRVPFFSTCRNSGNNGRNCTIFGAQGDLGCPFDFFTFDLGVTSRDLSMTLTV